MYIKDENGNAILWIGFKYHDDMLAPIHDKILNHMYICKKEEGLYEIILCGLSPEEKEELCELRYVVMPSAEHKGPFAFQSVWCFENDDEFSRTYPPAFFEKVK
jgi:hypothetical protein